MASQSWGKKVARAAATGGGRTSRGSQTPISWYGALALIVILGVASIAWSRYQRQNPTSAPSATVHPTMKDHWHEAFSFDVCGVPQPNPPQPAHLIGLHTHGDGLIHVEPQGPQDTGHNANLGRFVSGYPGMGLTSTSVTYPGQRTWTNGQVCTSGPYAGKAGYVQLKVWNSLADPTGHIVTGNPDKLLIENGALLTIAFVPKGASIPQPASKTNLANPNAAESNSSSNPSASSSTTPTTSHP
jgi:hypothetical protein